MTVNYNWACARYEIKSNPKCFPRWNVMFLNRSKCTYRHLYRLKVHICIPRHLCREAEKSVHTIFSRHISGNLQKQDKWWIIKNHWRCLADGANSIKYIRRRRWGSFVKFGNHGHGWPNRFLSLFAVHLLSTCNLQVPAWQTNSSNVPQSANVCLRIVLTISRNFPWLLW
jgi:hypothetical protein